MADLPTAGEREEELSALGLRQQAAIVAYLRAVAEGELAAEEARCRLCEATSFDVFEAFLHLQRFDERKSSGAAHPPLRGWIEASDILAFVTGQTNRRAGVSLSDVSTAIAPYCGAPRLFGRNVGGVDALPTDGARNELRYEGFLRLVLPRDPRHAWLQEALLSRGLRGSAAMTMSPSWRSVGRQNGKSIPLDVVERLCKLLDSEIELARHLKFHRKFLEEMKISERSFAAMLELDEDSSGSAALFRTEMLKHVLVHKRQMLNAGHCDALLRRVNPGGSSILTTRDFLDFFALSRASLSLVWPLNVVDGTRRASACGFWTGNSAGERAALQDKLTVVRDGFTTCLCAPTLRDHLYRMGARRPWTFQSQSLDAKLVNV